MQLKFDIKADQFIQTNTATYQDRRSYFVLPDKLFLLVLRNGLQLPDIEGKTVDANIGWDSGTPGYVDNDCIGIRHSKLTVYSLVGEAHEKTLSDILQQTKSKDKLVK